MLKFYVIDTETTGLKPNWHEIIQVSIIRADDGAQRTFNIRAEFPQRASPDALRIIGKSVHDLKLGEDKSDVVSAFEEFLEEDQATPGHRCMVGHNVSFDRRFMHALWDACNKKLRADLWLCTKSMSNKLAKKKGIIKPKLALANAMELAGVKSLYGAHNATVDVINTTNLFKVLMAENLNHVSLIKSLPHQ